MATDLPDKDTSLWLDTTEKTNFPALKKSAAVFDTVVAGGGIAGILTAWLLQKDGLKTAIVEKNRIIENTTGNTTAKLTSQHDLIYDFLIKKHGKESASLYATSNQQAVDRIEKIAQDLKIDCDFERTAAYVYTSETKKIKDVEAEVKAAKSLGLPASLDVPTELPLEIMAAVKFDNQAQFHPRKFLLGIVEDYLKKGGLIFEQTEASDIEPGSTETLVTKNGSLTAKNIVVATKYAFWQPKIFEAASWTKLSYALGVKLKPQADYPLNMYINTYDEGPVRTIRSHPYKGSRILIFGGESHKLTKDYDKAKHYQKLVDEVKERFDCERIIYRWIAGDVMPHEKLPFVGRYPKRKNIYVISGFNAWGLAWGMAAAELIRDQILDRSNPLSKMLDPARLGK